MTPTSFPPHHLHTSTRLPPPTALTLLSTYLAATTTDPSLHPNALLTENGPITPSSGANTGLVLHNLARVEAGLKGEVLAPEIDFHDGGGDDVVVAAEVGGGKGAEGMDLEWQDRSDFEREQEVVRGEEGGRMEGGKEARKKAKAERRRVERVGEERRKKREKDAER